MGNKYEEIKQDIELRYLPIEKQEKKAGYVVGNSNFDEKQLDQLKRFKPTRDKIWKDIEKDFDPEQCFNIAGVILEGFIFMEEDNRTRDLSRAYLASKNKILDYVKKQNEKLIKQSKKITKNEKDLYFQHFPIQIDITPHHLDSPTNAHRPTIGKTGFTKRIGAELEDHFPTKYGRAKLVSRVLRFFFAVPKDQADPKNIRNQF